MRGLALFESGAILMYLADKTGKFFPQAGEPRLRVIEWLMWQMSAIGPMLGRAHAFLHFNPGKAPYAEEWFAEEARRLYGVLDRQLAATGFLAGEYSIADMATFPGSPATNGSASISAPPQREGLVPEACGAAAGHPGLCRAGPCRQNSAASGLTGSSSVMSSRAARHYFVGPGCVS